MSGKGRGKGDKSLGRDGEEGDEEERELSVLYDDWSIPEMRARRKRESVGELIKSSPERALSVVRRWMNEE